MCPFQLSHCVLSMQLGRELSCLWNPWCAVLLESIHWWPARCYGPRFPVMNVQICFTTANLRRRIEQPLEASTSFFPSGLGEARGGLLYYKWEAVGFCSCWVHISWFNMYNKAYKPCWIRSMLALYRTRWSWCVFLFCAASVLELPIYFHKTIVFGLLEGAIASSLNKSILFWNV